MLSDTCKNRLENWKFGYAQQHAETARATAMEREVVEALSTVFANAGWFGGTLGVVVGAAVSRVLDGYSDVEPGGFELEWQRHLWSWEFDSAMRTATGLSRNESRVLEALAYTFGDDADFDGALGPVIQAARDRVLEGWPDEEEP